MKRVGSQNPTKSKIIPYIKTNSERAIKRYEKSGRKVYEWQKLLLDPILSLNDENLWVHMKFGFSVPRQNGKNEVVAIREIEGLYEGEKILHTAHRTATSASSFERLLAILESSGLIEGEDFRKIKATGREQIELFETGGLINFRTRTATGGLGESYDVVIIDEAQEYTDEQESALKYTIAASQNPQTIFIGTPPTPVSSGTVFANLRKSALDGKMEDVGWAEWSVENESDVNDVDLWYQTNPSLGIRLTERIIRTEVGEDEIDFNIQRLGLWIKYNQKSEITAEEWNRLRVDHLPILKGKLFVGIKYGNDGKNVAMSIAVKTNDEKIFVEAIDCQNIRNGNSWIISFLKQAEIQSVVVDGANGQMLLKNEMEDFRLKSPIFPRVLEIINANASFEQAIFAGTLSHLDQPSLTQVSTNVEKRNIQNNGGFGYKSQINEYEIALLDSAILAYWSCFNYKPKKKQKIYY